MNYIALIVTIILFFNSQALPFCKPEHLLQRSLDGFCNNLFNKNLGKTVTFFKTGPEGREAYPWAYSQKLSPHPNYSDDHLLPYDGPRGNPRNISEILCKTNDENKDDEVNHSMFSTMYGQFINHDLENNHHVDAENLDDELAVYIKDRQDTSCLPTPLPPLPHGYRCNDEDRVLIVNMKSSYGQLQDDDTMRVYNNATSYLDLDLVYGRSENVNSHLRKKIGGKLLSTDEASFSMTIPANPPVTLNFTAEYLLPLYNDLKLPVLPVYKHLGNPATFFVAGDERVNENMALTLFHTIWMREHNKVCDELMERNYLWKILPQMFDEVIFQKARAITIAKYQHIIYTQYLPSVYGEKIMNIVGNYDGYRMDVDPSTLMIFAGAAFRYGHFTAKDYFALDSCGRAIYNGVVSPDQNRKQDYIGFQNVSPPQFTPLGKIVLSGGGDNILRGLINERTRPNGLDMSSTLRSFSNPNSVLDLASIDIHRARYNSIPNYQTLRKHYYGSSDVHENEIYGLPQCPSSLKTDDNIDDPLECYLYITNNTEIATKIKNLYRKIKLIDAIIGLQAESKIEGSSFGRTGLNIIGNQFKKVRDGDRFFYKSPTMFTTFTKQEKDEIESTTMGEILRRNYGGDELQFPENPFIVPENYRENLISSCS